MVSNHLLTHRTEERRDPDPVIHAQPTWQQALAKPAIEFSSTKLSPICGSVPPGLRGTLYRNGPARLERGGIRYGHWFDGDGAVLGIRFKDEATIASYRYIQTPGYWQDERQNRIYGQNYGTLPDLPWWQRPFVPLKNVANTSVLPLEDRLLALWEGGHPFALDLDSLETLSADRLGLEDLIYSAHPKVDPLDGNIYNFGFLAGRENYLQLYRSDRSGKVVSTKKHLIPRFSVVHDFTMTQDYLIFCLPPIELDILPVLLRYKPFDKCWHWQSKESTKIYVFDRNLDLKFSLETEPWFQWHFGNACQTDADIITFEVARYRDCQTNLFLAEVASGQTNRGVRATLYEISIDCRTQKIVDCHPTCDRGMEFPSVNPVDFTRDWRYTYFCTDKSTVDPRQEIVTAIGRYDRHRDVSIVNELGSQLYPVEPIYAADGIDGDRGWILTIVYDGNTHTSEVWIFAAEALGDEPVCRLSLPSVIPMGFHGCWHPQAKK
jgi:carotenoid cleavage dioxygenase-like enzyme